MENERAVRNGRRNWNDHVQHKVLPKISRNMVESSRDFKFFGIAVSFPSPTLSVLFAILPFVYFSH